MESYLVNILLEVLLTEIAYQRKVNENHENQIAELKRDIKEMDPS